MTDLLAFLTPTSSGISLWVGFLIALVVTAHILLTKANVTAAVGWIGLIWFAPYMGAVFYLVLGVNRVQRRAQKMRRREVQSATSTRDPQITSPGDEHMHALARALGLITRRPIETGNSIHILHNGDEAYPVMLTAISSAKASICLSSYIMRADRTGLTFVIALQAAQTRGVAVRVIVDGVGSGWIRSPICTALRRAGVPVGRFMHSPMPWRMPFLNLRSHKKILVVDGAIGFTGGINIADQNVMALNTPHPVQDTHFQITGPVVGQLVEAFALDWLFVAEERLDGVAWFPTEVELATDATPARVVTAGPDRDIEKIEYAVLEALACARSSVQIMTPYFLPDERLITALSLAAMRGVAVDVVLPEHSDHTLIDWAMPANVGPFLQGGGRIWRSPRPFRHSKVMVVDSQWCLIGSSNWDIRSFRLNFELCVEVYDKGLARTLEDLMLRYRGTPLTRDDIRTRRLPRRLRDAATRLLLPYL